MIVSDWISVLSLFCSVAAVYKSEKASKAAAELQVSSNYIQMAAVEIEIRKMIEDAKKDMMDVESEIQGVDKATAKGMSILQSKYFAAKEKYANAYDEACTKYLDGKIDRERFKKTYSDEIRNLVTDSNFVDSFREPQTKYHATVKVYKEWNDYENTAKM